MSKGDPLKLTLEPPYESDIEESTHFSGERSTNNITPHEFSHPNQSKEKNMVSNNEVAPNFPVPDIKDYSHYFEIGFHTLTNDPICKEIEDWFKSLKRVVLEQSKGVPRLFPSDKVRPSYLAREKLTVVFLGFLIKNKQYQKLKENNEILKDGWNFLKDYLDGWKKLDMEEIGKSKGIKNLAHFSELMTPQEVFIYLMNHKSKADLSIKLIQKLIIKWKVQYENQVSLSHVPTNNLFPLNKKPKLISSNLKHNFSN
ncbi:hypothetical protein DFH28DRAFT_1125489 [Melampsora americana]|nr:hypothetical protein DFH28DRAFT_1125489 [Melampsora americana]